MPLTELAAKKCPRLASETPARKRPGISLTRNPELVVAFSALLAPGQHQTPQEASLPWRRSALLVSRSGSPRRPPRVPRERPIRKSLTCSRGLGRYALTGDGARL